MLRINKRHVWTIIILITLIVISFFIVRLTDFSKLELFSPLSLFTYFGVLMGFSLTIYPFGLSMVVDIKSNINSLKELSTAEKDNLYDKLVSGFKEIKQDVWLIFMLIIFVVSFAILREIENPFGWDLIDYQIPETFFLSTFLISTLAIFDIMKTLFNLSEINLELLKKKK